MTAYFPRHSSMERGREARLARIKAARNEAPTYVTVTIPMSELKVGDYVEVVPTQRDVRGVEVESLVTKVEVSLDSWYVRTGPRTKTNVASVVATFANDCGVNVPQDFQVRVRRPV